MLGRYWYMEGADGRRYCWAKEPSFTCPIGSTERLGDPLEQACAEADMDPEWLLRRLKHGGYRKRVNGKLTDRCETCGHRLERHGFRCWIEIPREDEAAKRIASRLGLGGPMETLKSFYADTKREAERWAREEARIDKMKAADQ